MDLLFQFFYSSRASILSFLITPFVYLRYRYFLFYYFDSILSIRFFNVIDTVVPHKFLHFHLLTIKKASNVLSKYLVFISFNVKLYTSSILPSNWTNSFGSRINQTAIIINIFLLKYATYISTMNSVFSNAMKCFEKKNVFWP